MEALGRGASLQEGLPIGCHALKGQCLPIDCFGTLTHCTASKCHAEVFGVLDIVLFNPHTGIKMS